MSNCLGSRPAKGGRSYPPPAAAAWRAAGRLRWGGSARHYRDWCRITCFNGLGKTVAEHCEKGMKVLVHGRIHYTKWTDATATDRYGCEIIAEKVDFLSRLKSAENENPELVYRDDEIPF